MAAIEKEMRMIGQNWDHNDTMHFKNVPCLVGRLIRCLKTLTSTKYKRPVENFKNLWNYFYNELKLNSFFCIKYNIENGKQQNNNGVSC